MGGEGGQEGEEVREQEVSDVARSPLATHTRNTPRNTTQGAYLDAIRGQVVANDVHVATQVMVEDLKHEEEAVVLVDGLEQPVLRGKGEKGDGDEHICSFNGSMPVKAPPISVNENSTTPTQQR